MLPAWHIGNPARAVVFAFLIAYALAGVIAVSTHWYMEDAGAYWDAALRLRAGEPLYFTSPNPFDSALYWYAPWFAWAWVPLAYLPHGLVMAAWGAGLVAAAVYVLWPIRSPAGVALALLCLPDLLRTTSTGNVQPLLLAGLVWRMSPWMIALTASLKPWTLVFAVVHWRKPIAVAVTFAGATLLWLPALAYDLSTYPERGGIMTPGMLSVALVVARHVGHARSAGAAQGRPSTSGDPPPAPAWLPRAP